MKYQHYADDSHKIDELERIEECLPDGIGDDESTAEFVDRLLSGLEALQKASDVLAAETETGMIALNSTTKILASTTADFMALHRLATAVLECEFTPQPSGTDKALCELQKALDVDHPGKEA